MSPLEVLMTQIINFEGGLLPPQVIRAVGRAITTESLMRFWDTIHPALGDKSPKQIWDDGNHERVLNYINCTWKGDRP